MSVVPRGCGSRWRASSVNSPASHAGKNGGTSMGDKSKGKSKSDKGNKKPKVKVGNRPHEQRERDALQKSAG
jgi:hypothetical protein